MSPLPTGKVIPDRWAAHHRPVAAGTRTSPATFTRITEGPAPWPPPENWGEPDTLWEALVRVQQLNRDGNTTNAEQQTTIREYLITVPLDGPELRAGEYGDIIHVLGRQFRITNIMFGSLEFERDLICVDNLTQQNPG